MGLWTDTLEKIETNQYIDKLERIANDWRNEAILKTANAMLIADMFEKAVEKRPRDHYSNDFFHWFLLRVYA